MFMVGFPLVFFVPLENVCFDGQACFDDATEILCAVDMRLVVGENILGMPDTVMLLVSDTDQPLYTFHSSLQTTEPATNSLSPCSPLPCVFSNVPILNR